MHACPCPMPVQVACEWGADASGQAWLTSTVFLGMLFGLGLAPLQILSGHALAPVFVTGLGAGWAAHSLPWLLLGLAVPAGESDDTVSQLADGVADASRYPCR